MQKTFFLKAKDENDVEKIKVFCQENNIDFSEEKEIALNKDNDIRYLRKLTGLNRKQFSEYFGIPYRTIEDWENNKASCSNYLYKLLAEKIVREF